MRRIMIKPNELKIAEGDSVLVAQALGSSLGVCMYGEGSGIGGMVYTILPQKCGEKAADLRYVETAVISLYEKLLEAGVKHSCIRAKLAGGAKLFDFMSDGPEPDIGRENVEQARGQLQKIGVPILAEDTGENYGRTICFHPGDGSIDIETVGRMKYCI